MSLLTYFHKKNLIGLDIQANELRLIKLNYSSSLSVNLAQVMALPENVITEGKVVNPNLLMDSLKALANLTQTKGFSAAIALPAHCVISKKISLPSGLSQREKMAEIQENLNEYFPGVTETLSFDCVTLNKKTVNHKKSEEEILIVATRLEPLKSYIQVIQSAGWIVRIIDVDIYALMRAVQFNLKPQCVVDKIAFLNINETQSQFIITEDCEIIYHQLYNKSLISTVSDSFETLIPALKHKMDEHHIRCIYFSGIYTHLSDHIMSALECEFHYLHPFRQLNYSETFEPISKKMLLSLGLALRLVN